MFHQRLCFNEFQNPTPATGSGVSVTGKPSVSVEREDLNAGVKTVMRGTDSFVEVGRSFNLLFGRLNPYKIDVDECQNPTESTGCGIGAVCLNTIGSFTCRCSPGFRARDELTCEGTAVCSDLHITTYYSLL